MSKQITDDTYKLLFNTVLQELQIKVFLEYYLSIKHQRNTINNPQEKTQQLQ